MGCLCCGGARELGALCRACALEVVPCDGLIPDHLRSAVVAADAAAWLVDGFGSAHPIAGKATIGRHHDRDLAVLTASVSREHAELERGPAGWTIRDLGSRNGTFVDGVRCQRPMLMPPRALLKVGDVALWFLAGATGEATDQVVMTTADSGGVVRYQLGFGDAELCVVGSGDPSAGGALLWRPAGTASWSERSLAPLEFQLLRALCVRASAEVDSPSVVRGCIPTKQLARDLPFQSRYANEENVRQVVKRLRGVLAEAGAAGMLAIAPGRGYYVTATVTTATEPAR